MSPRPKFWISPHAQDRVRKRAVAVINEKVLLSTMFNRLLSGWDRRWEIIDGKGRKLLAIHWPQQQLFLLVKQSLPAHVVVTVLEEHVVMSNIESQGMQVLKRHGQEAA